MGSFNTKQKLLKQILKQKLFCKKFYQFLYSQCFVLFLFTWFSYMTTVTSYNLTWNDLTGGNESLLLKHSHQQQNFWWLSPNVNNKLIEKINIWILLWSSHNYSHWIDRGSLKFRSLDPFAVILSRKQTLRSLQQQLQRKHNLNRKKVNI